MAKILSVSAKCSDLSIVRFPSGKESNGYVPEGIGIGGGDYIEFDVDVETGQIIGWNQDIKDRINNTK